MLNILFCCFLSMSYVISFSSTHHGCLIAAQCSIFKSTTLKIVLLGVKMCTDDCFQRWVIFVRKLLNLSSGFNVFSVVKRVYTICHVYRSMIKEDIVGWFLSLTTQFYTYAFIKWSTLFISMSLTSELSESLPICQLQTANIALWGKCSYASSARV